MNKDRLFWRDDSTEMNIEMNDHALKQGIAISRFLEGTDQVSLTAATAQECYDCIATRVRGFSDAKAAHLA